MQTTGTGSDLHAISGQARPAASHHPILGLLITLDPGASYAQLLPADSRAFASVLQGAASIAGQGVRAGQTAWSDPVGENADRADGRCGRRTAMSRPG